MRDTGTLVMFFIEELIGKGYFLLYDHTSKSRVLTSTSYWGLR
jgi:hypothetical protein